ncbi:helix-turn-helix domain-containing protein [Methylobacterium sp. E-065]|uniref:helix-turn-helix domain-containing protein n=1 Tax=Methylobacterium sp. E-065 TaxID=2836583 RepID=UPI001FB9BB75|nr:helix-turn-helix domain-containing protein [Methylobacterium sp. E-065]MCJ2016428.1 helix-turn-helix domain-containing protein [Methylobacterium sp. E-065]
MTYAEEIRRQVEAAPRAALPAFTASLWRAYGEGKVTEAEAEALSVLIEAKRAAQIRTVRENIEQAPNPIGTGDEEGTATPRTLVQAARRAVGSHPRTDASMERRRRWAASGRLPPGLAARFTLAEQAVLSLVAAETVRRKDCRLSVPNLAAVAGVAETTVRNAIREARKLGLLTVEERQITGFRNDTNIVRIVSAEWTAWLRLARKGGVVSPPPSQGEGHHDSALQRGGCKSPKGTPTEVLDLGKSKLAEPKAGCRGTAGDPGRSDRSQTRAGGGGGRAMR